MQNHIICNQRTRCVIPQLILTSKRKGTRLREGQRIRSLPLPSPSLAHFTIRHPAQPKFQFDVPGFTPEEKGLRFASADRGGVINKAEQFAARESSLQELAAIAGTCASADMAGAVNCYIRPSLTRAAERRRMNLR